MRALLLGLLAMSIAQATPMTEIEITYEPDAWAAGKADTIAAQVPTGVPRAELLNHRNGAPFLHLAARNADARVVAAALLGMARTWSRTGKGDRPKVDADFRKVVLARLGDANGKVVAAALGAVRLLTGGIKPDAVALDRVLKLAVKGTAPGRAAAIDALVNVRAFQLPRAVPGDVKGRVVAAILPALDAKAPFLVATAAHRLARSAYVQMPHRDKLAAAAKRLEGHADPGVRAMALLIAARVAKATEKAEIASRLRRASPTSPPSSEPPPSTPPSPWAIPPWPTTPSRASTTPARPTTAYEASPPSTAAPARYASASPMPVSIQPRSALSRPCPVASSPTSVRRVPSETPAAPRRSRRRGPGTRRPRRRCPGLQSPRSRILGRCGRVERRRAARVRRTVLGQVAAANTRP